MRIVSWGHAFFAASLIMFGIMGLVTGGFTPIWTPEPRSLPGHQALAYLCTLIALGSGIGLFWRRSAAVAARVLCGFLLAWLLLLNVPFLLLHLGWGFAWAAGQMSVLLGTAWVLYVWFAGDWDRRRLGFVAGDAGLRIARILYGLGLIVFGIAHFTFLARTVSMVPGWLPWHLGWAYFFGCTFIAAGIALNIGVYARVAAALMVVQVGLFTVLVWIPVVLATPSIGDWHEFIVSVALTAAAWVMADSYRRKPAAAT